MEHHEFRHPTLKPDPADAPQMRADLRDEKRQFFSLNVHWYRFVRVIDIEDTFCQSQMLQRML
jgi:hypothetical protein